LLLLSLKTFLDREYYILDDFRFKAIWLIHYPEAVEMPCLEPERAYAVLRRRREVEIRAKDREP